MEKAETSSFYIKGLPDQKSVKPDDMVVEILGEPQNVRICSNTSWTLKMPPETIEGIKSLDPAKRERVKLLLFQAITDARRVILKPKR